MTGGAATRWTRPGCGVPIKELCALVEEPIPPNGDRRSNLLVKRQQLTPYDRQRIRFCVFEFARFGKNF